MTIGMIFYVLAAIVLFWVASGQQLSRTLLFGGCFASCSASSWAGTSLAFHAAVNVPSCYSSD